MTLCHYDKLYRNIYMDGPPNRGENKEDYITLCVDFNFLLWYN